MKNQKGITLIALALTVVIMAILAFTIAVDFTPYGTEKTRTDFESDLMAIEEEVSQYYAKNNELPVLNRYSNTSMIAGVRNLNDNDTYYVIDLNKITANLHYGSDFDKVLRKDAATVITDADDILDIFIINENSHTVYYPKGVEYFDRIHYRLAEPYTDVDGYETVYIYNKQQLEEFRDKVNNGTNFANAIVTLMNDIDLGCDEEDNTTWWTPIGLSDEGKAFSGIFDGNNHTISNLYIGADDENLNAEAFFGYIANATIKRLTVSGTVTVSNAVSTREVNKYMAAIIGLAEDSNTIDSCVNNANVTNESNIMGTGGIVGGINKSSSDIDCRVTISNCENLGTISGKRCIAGIVGDISYTKTISINNCSNYGEIVGMGTSTKRWRMYRKITKSSKNSY